MAPLVPLPPAEVAGKIPGLEGIDTREIANHLSAHEIINIMSAGMLLLEQLSRVIARLGPAAVVIQANTASYMKEPELINLDHLLKEHHAALRLSLDLTIDLELKLLAGRAIKADPNLLRAMFSNFAINATDALREVKDYRLKTFSIETLAINEKVLVRISDNGAGMTEESRQRILAGEKFTTKTAHCGEGMTYISEIIQKLGGTFSIRSDLGIGTTFTLYFPAASVE